MHACFIVLLHKFWVGFQYMDPCPTLKDLAAFFRPYAEIWLDRFEAGGWKKRRRSKGKQHKGMDLQRR